MKFGMSYVFLQFFKAVGFAGVALAGVTTPGGGVTTPITINLPNPLRCNEFGCVATAIINALFTVSIPVVSIMILVGAFQILTAGGSPEKVTKGRDTIFWAVVGFFVILVANGIVAVLRELFA